MFGRLSLVFVVVSIVAFFCAQPTEAAKKGPKVTHKIYFDMKHGEQELGRSTSLDVSVIGCLSPSYEF